MKAVFKLYLFFLFLLLQSAASAQVANFTADVTAGCPPLLVNFTNTSTGGATSYSWDLNNGTTTTNLNASGSYVTSGTYTVTLKAYNGSVVVSTKTMKITVYPTPVVDFTVSNTTICLGSSMQLTDIPDPTTTGAVTYSWNFGDGGTDNSQNPTHTYSTAGDYNITLGVTNSFGCNTTIVKKTLVHVQQPPVVNFTQTTGYCKTPAHVVFTDQTTGAGGYTYDWDMGDGTHLSQQNPTHDYLRSGSYNVTLTVTDKNGCKATFTKPSAVRIDSIKADFANPASACVNSKVFFNNTTYNVSLLNSTWNFGDNTGDLAATNGSHTYVNPGTYKVRLIVSNGFCNDTVIKQITINSKPAITVTSNPSVPCPAPATVTLTASSSPGTTFQWYFPDNGATATGSSQVHTFNANEFDTVRIIATNGNGCIDTLNYINKVYDMYLDIKGKNQGCIPFSTTLAVTVKTHVPQISPGQYPSSIATTTYDFGDGSGVTNNATHTYTVFGSYTVKITVTTANGCTISDTFHVDAGVPPQISLSVAPTHICVGGLVTFHVSATGTGPLTYSYNYGDGTVTLPVRNDSVSSYKYLTPGIYGGFSQVPLKPYVSVFNNGCKDSVFAPVITVDSPRAKMTLASLCDTPLKVNVSDISLGGTSRLWIWGDGGTDTTAIASHLYGSLGLKTVTIIERSSRSGCSDTVSADIKLMQLTPTFTADKTAICKGGVVNFTPVVTGNSSYRSYWYVNNVLTDTTTGPAIFTDTFYTPGKYTVMLKVQDELSCFTSLTRTDYITVAKPIPYFSAPGVIGCSPFNATLSDTSVDVPGANIVSRTWRFGDNTSITGTASTVTHLYKTPGFYDVTLIVTDNIGCTESLQMPGYVQSSKPAASFTAGTTAPCAGVPVTFNNSSIIFGAASAFWYFGDGDTSSVYNPTHIYKQNGIYTVTLVVTDGAGCKDTLTKPAYLNVSRPVAAFLMSDSISACPQLTINFTNTSLNAVKYYWDFGNGNTSYLANPGNTYATAGIFTVTLVATNASGCSDTITKPVRLLGYTGAFSYASLLGCSPLTVNFTASITGVPNICFDFTDGTISPKSSSLTASHTYTVPGKYVPKMILVDNKGCSSSSLGIDTITVDKVISRFTAFPACIHDTVQFRDTSFSYYSPVTKWMWFFDDGKQSSAQRTYHIYDTTGRYAVVHTVMNANGCVDTLSTMVTINPLPNITATKDTTICLGDGATLTGHGGISYTWLPSATLSCASCTVTVASPAVATKYTVTGTDANGCRNKDTVTVKLRTKTTSIVGKGGEICDGDSILLSSSGATDYAWYPPDGLNNSHISNPVSRPHNSITYLVVAKLASCTPDSNRVSIIVHPKPKVKATGSTTIIAGYTAELQASGTNVTTFEWSPAGSLNCANCANPQAKPDTTTVYTVLGYTDYGCIDSDKVKIDVLCDHSQVFIPNTFTPNGDGQNDVFYPRGLGISVIQSFRIYNRWGELLFSRSNFRLNDEIGGWDGSYKGGLPRPDVYVYVIDAICAGGSPISWKGDVTLIR